MRLMVSRNFGTWTTALNVYETSAVNSLLNKYYFI